jgi:hydrogenase-4 component B
MPRTALAFVIGAIAIIGLPPLNGFVSEWMLLLGFLGAGHVAGALRWTSLGAAGIGIVGALALVCFVRLVGIVFLGQPRARVEHDPCDVDRSLSLPMGLLATACVSIGLAPGFVLGFALRVAGLVTGAHDSSGAISAGAGPPARLGLFAALLLTGIASAWVLRGTALRRSSRRSATTWGCAYSAPTARMQYTAASFSSPTLIAFPVPAGPERARLAEQHVTSSSDRIMRNVARPLWNRLQALALSVRPLQQGRVTTYLQYMIWTVLLLLGFLLFTSTGARP